jgi:hypothetical protein
LIERELGSSEQDKRQLTARLDNTRNQLNRVLDERTKLTESESGVESLVAHAITKGLSMPASIAAMTLSRGPVDLPLTMTPDRTSARFPVHLKWSGQAVTDYQVEITQDGKPVWKTRVEQPEVMLAVDVLKHGNVYEWRVASGSKHGPWAGFRVSTVAESLRASKIDKDRNLGPLEKGVAYAALGLVPEAQSQFKLLRASHPSLANRLSQELEKIRK